MDLGKTHYLKYVLSRMCYRGCVGNGFSVGTVPLVCTVYEVCENVT